MNFFFMVDLDTHYGFSFSNSEIFLTGQKTMRKPGDREFVLLSGEKHGLFCGCKGKTGWNNPPFGEAGLAVPAENIMRVICTNYYIP
jgi:hypothetical protein